MPYEKIVLSGKGYISTEAMSVLSKHNRHVILVDTYGNPVTFCEPVRSSLTASRNRMAQYDAFRDKEKITEQEFNEKLQELKEKKSKGGFTKISASFKGFVVKNYSKKKAINKIQILQKQQETNIQEWEKNPSKIFYKEQKETFTEIKQFDQIKKDPFYRGARGEVDVLKKIVATQR